MAATGALSQILQYSDSSEEENAENQDDVTDSKHDEKQQDGKRPLLDEENPKENSKNMKKPRLELPSALVSMFGGGDDAKQENTSLHQGRVRSFAHERGHWATYVYLPVDRDVIMKNLVDDLVQSLPKSSDWHQMATLHLSLSRTVVVYHHWIDELVSALTASFSPHAAFDCLLGAVEVYTNDEKTRTFLGLTVTTGYSELRSLVQVVDKCLAEFQLQEYYKNPSFHVSVAWMLGDVTDKITSSHKENIQDILANHLQLNPTIGSVDTGRAEAKCGNKCFSFNLSGS